MPTPSPTQNKRSSSAPPWKRWAHIGLVLGWAVLNYSVDNQIYGLAILAFFVVLSAVVRRHFLCVGVPALLAILLWTPVPATLTALVQSNQAVARQPDSRISAILTPNSGREVLPREVRHMISLLHSRQLDTYRVSDGIRGGPLWQRLVEGLWPARPDPASPYIFRLSNEQADSPCRLVQQRENVILERCP